LSDSTEPSATRRGSSTINRPRFFYGWIIVGGAFLSDMLFYGVGTVAFGIFFRFMSEGLQWSRGLLATAILLGRLTALISSPIIGPLVDRHGPRWVMLFGTWSLGIGALFMAAVNAPWQFFLAYGGLMTLGTVGMGEIASHTAVAKWFVRKRGRALAVVTMGLSGAGIVIPLPLAALITGLGWRGAWIVLGIAVLVIGTGASLVMRRQPEDYGLLPDGDLPHETTSTSDDTAATITTAADSEVSLTPRQALRTQAFWLLIVSSNAAGMALMGINIHLVSFLLDSDFSLTTAASIVTFLYVLQTVAKPMWGLIVERLHVRYCIGICYLGGGIGTLLLLNVSSLPTVVAFALVYGLTRGAQSLLTSLAWADYFGRASQGGIRGISAPFRIVSGAGGPMLAGLLYDAYGSYTVAFITFAVLFWIGGIAMVLARPPQVTVATPQAAA